MTANHDTWQVETRRIQAEYRRRAEHMSPDTYSLTKPVNLFMYQQRARHVLKLLNKVGLIPLKTKKILEVGCGVGRWLADLEAWGARRSHMAGIDLNEARVAEARRLCGDQRDENGQVLHAGADIRYGNATDLPWPDSCFDIVFQSTMFTSILSAEVSANSMRRARRPEHCRCSGAGTITMLGMELNGVSRRGLV